MSLKFGTSGLRGLSVDLKGKASAVYATAFARHLLKSGQAKAGDPILVGRDFRDSSPDVSATCIGALKKAGLVPLDCGTVPTPALALYGLSLKAAALMITGSHIPADRNGIKFYRPDGEIDKQDETAIAALAKDVEAEGITDEAAAAEDRSSVVAELFYERNISLLPTGALSGLKIGVYQHSTVARDLFVDVLAHYGADVVPLGRSETFIPVDTEAVSPETLDLLKKWSAEHKLDAIVSADGDGDRPLLADEKGIPLRGDLIGLITANFLEAGVVVTPVTSNSGIEASGHFAVTRTKVGSPFVIAGMGDALAAGKNGVMGFEANGGLLTASTFTVNGKPLAPLPTRDSFLPVLAVLLLSAEQKKPLSEIASAYNLPVAAADRLENFAQEKSAALMSYLRASKDNLAKFLEPVGAVKATSDIDGLRVALTNGSTIHFRPSGNAPEMRCYVEAANQDEAETLLHKGLDLIRNFG
ncbi:polysaccharide biosynthesis phosphomannomutase UppO [Rhizobium sp. RM]|uniref:polysaccharide biosynthesis phosphomannomutase UppO n=1 Tax=Rhizobium sp. RM TaxID=2748079 RepID=UPI00110E411C|nr:polysaccharide biosynthesis phosphomannomutase UppO [Rhizobium sp. RM]NWJ26921.1 phosphomannomutase [Rhizobium sp. RM]TMV22786.1 phosphomannomutase [Rhizobium sp. Td3]